jgi:hypothetical protein
VVTLGSRSSPKHFYRLSHENSPIQFLHLECNELIVKDHLELLSAQYLARAMRLTYASHAVVTTPPGPRRIKETLHSKCIVLFARILLMEKRWR